MRPYLVSSVLACCFAPSTQADVLLVPITQATQKERSGERFAIALVKPAAGSYRVTIAVRPSGSEKFNRADLEVHDQGKWALSVPIKATADKVGSLLELALTPAAAARCRLEVLIDSTDPDRPKTGKLYRIELGSYFPKE